MHVLHASQFMQFGWQHQLSFCHSTCFISQPHKMYTRTANTTAGAYFKSQALAYI